MIKKYLFLLLLCTVYLSAGAHPPREDSSQQAYPLENIDPMDGVDYSKIHLPPISTLLDAANNYADVMILKERVAEKNQELKISRKEWLRYFRLQSNYQYGTNSAYLLQSGDPTLPNGVGSSSTNTQSWYNAGAILSIPLDDLFSRKNKNSVVRSRIKQTEYEAEKVLEERQIRILEAYNLVVKNLTLLKVKAEAMALYEAQMKISERDFTNGRIDIISLSLERARRADAIVSYQENRAELYNAVTVLEMLTKIKIIKN